MVKLILKYFILFCTNTCCFYHIVSSQNVSLTINDSSIYLKDRRSFATLNLNITNNTDTSITLLFFNNRVYPSFCNSFDDELLFMLDSNISEYDLNCSGLRFVIKNNRNDVVQPQIINSKQINSKYRCKWSIYIINKKVINSYIQPLFLLPHENKSIKIKIYFKKVWKYPLFILNKSTLVKHSYPLKPGVYSVFLYYLVNINQNYHLPDYVKYSKLCIPSPTSSQINGIINYPSLKNYLVSGYFKSNEIKIKVK